MQVFLRDADQRDGTFSQISSVADTERVLKGRCKGPKKVDIGMKGMDEIRSL